MVSRTDASDSNVGVCGSELGGTLQRGLGQGVQRKPGELLVDLAHGDQRSDMR